MKIIQNAHSVNSSPVGRLITYDTSTQKRIGFVNKKLVESKKKINQYVVGKSKRFLKLDHTDILKLDTTMRHRSSNLSCYL